jgi:hypothetical protein
MIWHWKQICSVLMLLTFEYSHFTIHIFNLNFAMKFFLAFFLSIFTFSSQAQSMKTLIKTLDPEGASTILFNFDYKKLIHKKWDEKFVRVQMEIHTNLSEALLTQLIKAGRYNLEGTKENDEFTITAHNLQKKLTVAGKTVEEEIILNVDVPAFLSVSEDKIKHSAHFKNKNPKNIKPINIVIEYIAVSSDASFKYSLAKPVLNLTSGSVVKKLHLISRELGFEELEKLFGEVRINGDRLNFK